MQRAQPEFKRANESYLAYARGELEPDAAAQDAAEAERSIRGARDALTVLDPPADARPLHDGLVRYLQMNVEIARETTRLASYVPAAERALRAARTRRTGSSSRGLARREAEHGAGARAAALRRRRRADAGRPAQARGAGRAAARPRRPDPAARRHPQARRQAAPRAARAGRRAGRPAAQALPPQRLGPRPEPAARRPGAGRSTRAACSSSTTPTPTCSASNSSSTAGFAERSLRPVRRSMGREERSNMAEAVRVSVTVNGRQQPAEVEPRLLLVHFLRDTLGLTGTHVGCDTSNCGACTVHLDGEAVKSCTRPRRPGGRRGGDDDRGHGAGGQPASPAGRLLGAPRAPVRLLHAGHDHGRGGPAGTQSRPERARRPRGARGQPLPLHRLPEHRQVRARSRRGDARRRGPARGPRGGAGMGVPGVEAAERTEPSGNGHVGRAHAAQGGPAPDHGARDLRRRHGAPGHAVRRDRALARGPRPDPLDRHRGGQGAPGRRGGLHRRGHGRPGRAVPDGVGAAGGRDAGPGPLAARPRQGGLRRPGGRGRRRDGQVRRRRRRRGRDRRVRPAARRDRPRAGARGGRAGHPRGVRHQQGLRMVAAGRRRRGRVPRRRRDRREAHRQPPHGRRGDRAARRPGRVAPGQAHDVERDPDPAHRARDPLDPARDHRGQDPRRGARGRRRLRLQAAGLRRGGARLLARPPDRQPVKWTATRSR